MKTLNNFCEHLETRYSKVHICDLHYLRKLIMQIKVRKNSDFNKLNISIIEKEHPYWLLEIRYVSVPVFLLYKREIEIYLTLK